LLRFFVLRSCLSEEIAWSRWWLSSGLGIRRAAVFAEPAVAKIEEVVRLVHGEKNGEQ
jgi:hypothetical protein